MRTRTLFLMLSVGVLTILIGLATWLAVSIGGTQVKSVEVLYSVPTQELIFATPLPFIVPLNADALGYFRTADVLVASAERQPAIQPLNAFIPGSSDALFSSIPHNDQTTPLPYPTTQPLDNALVAEARGNGCAPRSVPVIGDLTQPFHAAHSGIDIRVAEGTPVFATHSATVVFARWSTVGYGNLVILQDGSFITYYAHNSSLLVASGQRVTQGMVIALSGTTGNSTGPHVHFETRVLDVPVDPLTFDGYRFASC